jgi:arginyl-tRNA synthetase
MQQRLVNEVRACLSRCYDLDWPRIVVEQPPRVEMGEYAVPVAFELAKVLKQPPRKIAGEIIAGMGTIEGIEKLEIAGAGFINVRLARGAAAAAMMGAPDEPAPAGTWQHERILVEHTSVNPNKAAHIGHLRNAILGDTFVRLLRAGGADVDVQNYIDNTGVQVADVVAGFVHVAKKSRDEIESLIAAAPRFDYYCWDLYAQVSRLYESRPESLAWREQAMHAIEQGGNECAAIADLVSTAVLTRHLQTMERLGIAYDFLPRESEILHLKFWESAFRQLKEKGVLRFETEGKNAGCWVMQRPSRSESAASGSAPEPESSAAKSADDSKVIVRSNGTVGYVGKDIAYHLWKFGLLGKDFGYRPFFRYAGGHECWISAEAGEAEHPRFGEANAIYNVIDARQAEAQNAVIDALRAMGYGGQADHYRHFSYEMVALTPRCADELGYELSEDDRARSYIEISGRRGFGVKADDLIDRLILSAEEEVETRHPELEAAERRRIASQIAVGALRYFMLKFTKNSVIAFDFKDALSFEGETGPYVQYAVVRAASIFRKAGLEPEETLQAGQDFSPYFSGENGTEIWELWLLAAKTSFVMEQCVATAEPAYAAKHAFQLAQLFNNFYHKHRILNEPDECRRRFLLATVAVVRRELIRVLEVMGISAPTVM